MNYKPYLLCLLLTTFCIRLNDVQAQKKPNNSSEMTSKLIQPPYLKVGDTVAIVAPSGILKNNEDEVQQAIKLLKSWGLHAVVGKHVFNQADHFAGTDNERCEDLQNAMDNPQISAIWCAKGGYGTVRILDKLDFSEFRQHPKWIIGYSDITALHNLVHKEGFQSLHALMCISLTKNLKDIKESLDTFKSAIFGHPENYTLEGSSFNKVGETSGELIGGNLTVLHTMLGSKTSLDTSGKILFIEEIGEYKYHIDRMLQSMKRAGYFDNLNGLIVGNMSKMRKNTTLWGTSAEELIIDALEEYDFPIAFNMPAGHEKDNRALVLGRKVNLVVGKSEATLKFSE